MNQEALKQNFEKHGFSTSFFDDHAEALAYLEEKLAGRTIGFGGSLTLRQIGLFEALSKKNAVLWHHQIPSDEVKKLASGASVYISSANGVSEEGSLVNIDGVGNRVAATLYGPKEVYYVVGRNKVFPLLAEAMHHAKHVAAPKNAQNLGRNTPCAKDGLRCYNCNSPERICRATVIVERPPKGMDVEILFIDEDLGL